MPRSLRSITWVTLSVPYINIKLVDDQLSAEKKAEVISEVTNVMVRVLKKDPATTWVIIDEISTDNFGIAGQSVSKRRAPKK